MTIEGCWTAGSGTHLFLRGAVPENGGVLQAAQAAITHSQEFVRCPLFFRCCGVHSPGRLGHGRRGVDEEVGGEEHVEKGLSRAQADGALVALNVLRHRNRNRNFPAAHVTILICESTTFALKN